MSARIGLLRDVRLLVFTPKAKKHLPKGKKNMGVIMTRYRLRFAGQSSGQRRNPETTEAAGRNSGQTQRSEVGI